MIGRWIHNIGLKIQCEIYGDGEQRRDFTHVDDIDVLVLMMEQSTYGYEFELSQGKNYSVNEIESMFQLDPVYKDAWVEKYTQHGLHRFDVLGWVESTNIEDYIKSYIDERT